MKKMINKKRTINLKKILIIIVTIIFLLYTSLLLLVSNRKYLYVEKIFKTISSKINEYLIDNCYNINDKSLNIVSSRINYLEKENEMLRNESNLSLNNSKYVLAEITNHVSKTWFDRVIINKGYKDDIKVDMPVVTSSGLVGFISKVGRKISEVNLLTNINNKNVIPVIIQNKAGDISGILSNYDSKNNLFKVTDVTSKIKSNENDTVVLAGYENNLYKGIYVGKVVKEETSNYGLSKTIWIRPGCSFNDLLFVSVVMEK